LRKKEKCVCVCVCVCVRILRNEKKSKISKTLLIYKFKKNFFGWCLGE
jgi:hypothetical protein